MPDGTLTPSMKAVGLSVRKPSSSMKRWNIRMAANCRAILFGARSFARNWPTYFSITAGLTTREFDLAATRYDSY